MKFIPGSHKKGFFERVISSEEGNVLSDNRSMIIPENWREKTYQSSLSPGQCTFHDGNLRNSCFYRCYLVLLLFSLMFYSLDKLKPNT